MIFDLIHFQKCSDNWNYGEGRDPNHSMGGRITYKVLLKVGKGCMSIKICRYITVSDEYHAIVKLKGYVVKDILGTRQGQHVENKVKDYRVTSNPVTPSLWFSLPVNFV